MAGGVERDRGGILALSRLIERFEGAIAFDLLTICGWSLDDLGISYSWRDLWVLVMRWQKTPGTATCEAVQGVVHWPTTDQLLAIIADILQHANWQRLGKRHAAKPKRIPRPWEKSRATKLGSKPVPISQFNSWWDSKTKGVGRGRRRRRARDSMDPPRSDG